MTTACNLWGAGRAPITYAVINRNGGVSYHLTYNGNSNALNNCVFDQRTSGVRSFSAIGSGPSSSHSDALDRLAQKFGVTIPGGPVKTKEVDPKFLEHVEQFTPYVSGIYEQDVAKREDFIKQKFLEKFKLYKDIDAINYLVSVSEPLAQWYARIIEEWNLIADRPEFSAEYITPEEYAKVKQATLMLNQANKVFSDATTELSVDFKTKRKELVRKHEHVLRHIRDISDKAWVVSLPFKDMPITLHDKIRTEHPIPSPTYTDDNGNVIKRDVKELIALRTERSARINNYMRSFKVWMLKTSKETQRPLYEIWQSVVLNFDFVIGESGPVDPTPPETPTPNYDPVVVTEEDLDTEGT